MWHLRESTMIILVGIYLWDNKNFISTAIPSASAQSLDIYEESYEKLRKTQKLYIKHFYYCKTQLHDCLTRDASAASVRHWRQR